MDNPIIGGIFGTQTKWDANGNVVIQDEFHLRIYRDLWESEAIHRLKGNMLHVYLTIALHLDNQGHGWPTQETIAEMCGISRDTVNTSIKKLIKEGFIETKKVRSEKGKFTNIVYKIKFAPKNNHEEKSDMDEKALNQSSIHAEKTYTDDPCRKNRHGNSDTKEDPSFKKDLPNNIKKRDRDLLKSIYRIK